MSENTKTYKIGSTQQLIDLNKDHKNFQLKFFVTSHNPEDVFEALVVNQTELDSGEFESMEYKKAKGSISGNIRSDKNIYQNYFLSLRGENECDVEVRLELEKLPDNIEDPAKNDEAKPESDKKPFYKSKIFWGITIAIVLVVIGYVAFEFYNKKKKNDTPAIEAPVSNELIETKSNAGSVKSSKNPSPSRSYKSASDYSSPESSVRSSHASKIGSPLRKQLENL